MAPQIYIFPYRKPSGYQESLQEISETITDYSWRYCLNLFIHLFIFRTIAYLEPKACSGDCQTSMIKCFAKNSYLGHFPAQAQKIKKIHPEKNSF